jgi:hypothetical protein
MYFRMLAVGTVTLLSLVGCSHDKSPEDQYVEAALAIPGAKQDRQSALDAGYSVCELKDAGFNEGKVELAVQGHLKQDNEPVHAGKVYKLIHAADRYLCP